MAIYRETFKLKSGCFSLSDFLSKIEKHTGLNFDMEVIDNSSAFILCKKFKNVSIEINIEDGEKVNIYFPPKKKKYLEYSIINILNEYVCEKIDIPDYAKKRWSNLSFFEKLKYH